MSKNYDEANVFAKMLRKEIPADVVYEDDHCVAFRDITPKAPTHILVIPKQPIAKLADTGPEDRAVLGHLLWAVAEVARLQGVDQDGYRVVVNSGERANQTVFHLHLHLLAGRNFNWPPG